MTINSKDESKPVFDYLEGSNENNVILKPVVEKELVSTVQ